MAGIHPQWPTVCVQELLNCFEGCSPKDEGQIPLKHLVQGFFSVFLGGWTAKKQTRGCQIMY